MASKIFASRFRRVLAMSIAALVVSATFTAPAYAIDFVVWKNQDSGKCLGITGGSMTNGTKAVQWTCNGNPDQSWVAVTNGEYHHLRNKANQNKCLGVPSGSKTKGVQLVIWDCLDTATYVTHPVCRRSISARRLVWCRETHRHSQLVDERLHLVSCPRGHHRRR